MTKASFIYLKATNHVLSSFTRNGATEDINEEQLPDLLSNRLRLRNVQKTALAFSDLVPTNAPFELKPSELSVFNKVIDDPFLEGGLTRPLNFRLEDDSLKPIAKTEEAVERLFSKIEYRLESNGVFIELTPLLTQLLGPDPIKVWALLKLAPDGIFDSRAGEVPGETTIVGKPNNTILPFASVPAGLDHELLLAIEGIFPIADRVKIDSPLKPRVWP